MLVHILPSISDVPHILNYVHVQVPLLCDVATHDHHAGVLGTTPGFAYIVVMLLSPMEPSLGPDYVLS